MQIQTLGYSSKTLEFKLYWILSIAAGFCFIGHGVLTKAEWLLFFEVAHISPRIAYIMMSIIGTVDILMGIIVLIKPMRFAVVFMIFWAT